MLCLSRHSREDQITLCISKSLFWGSLLSPSRSPIRCIEDREGQNCLVFESNFIFLKAGICEIVKGPMNLGDLNKVWEIKALKKKPRGDEAMKILEKVANQVQPIMTRRKWRVKLLSEFW